jgi:hypothetical protein
MDNLILCYVSTKRNGNPERTKGCFSILKPRRIKKVTLKREREREFETMIVEAGFIEKKRRMNLLNDKLGKRRMIEA